MALNRFEGRTLTTEKAVATVAASPEFVLDVLRDNHRQQCAFDPEAEPDVQLTFDTTVAEWRNACDLVGAKGLGEALNEIWELTIPPEEWQAVLEPPKSRTLRAVCELISSQAQRTSVLKAGYLGASCRSAAVFLTVRSLLIRAGVDAAAVRPSAPIADAAKNHPDAFLGPISRLAPGKLPTVAVRTPIYSAALTMCVVGAVGAFAFAGRYPSVAFASALVAGLGVAGTWIAARFTKPAEVRFGTIVTFRDLATVIAGDKPDPVPTTE